MQSAPWLANEARRHPKDLADTDAISILALIGGALLGLSVGDDRAKKSPAGITPAGLAERLADRYALTYVAYSGLPSASILRTSPSLSSRTPLSTLLMSPTTTHTSLPGAMVRAASALACSGVIASTVPVKVS